jgi:molybdate transport system substrate-binding protein
LATAFEEAHPDRTVAISFAASSTLVTQILEGAPADVFASADVRTMDRIVAAGLAGPAEPQAFATNRMVIAVAPDNPLGVSGIDDLSDRADLTVVLCISAAPCGAFADEIFRRSGLAVPAVGREPNVKAVLTKVALGEADAGIVYVTDLTDAVAAVPIPEAGNVVASYPIVALGATEHPEAAAEFVAFVLSPPGQSIMASYGFSP